MKRFFSALIALISIFLFAFVFTACGKGTENIAHPADEGLTSERKKDIASVSDHKHNFGEWIVMKEPTCAESGSKKRLCECGEAETERIPAIGHKFFDGECIVCGVKNSFYGAEETEGLKFFLKEDDTYEVVGYEGESTEVFILSRHDGKAVTSVGRSAFENLRDVVRVVVSDGVAEIKCGAFKNCYDLVSVRIGSGMALIDEDAFDGCYKLTEVINGSELSVATGSGENGKVGYYARTVYPKLYAAGGTTSTENGYVIYREETTVALMGYTGTATALTVPNSVTEIYEYAFYKKTNIESISFSSTVKSIGQNAFKDCSALKSVTMNTGLTTIKNGAFEGCTKLATVTVPAGVTTIDWSAFYECSELKTIVLPASLATVGEWAFYNCHSLVKVDYKGTLENWCKINFKDVHSNPLRYATNLFINGVVLSGAISIANTVTQIPDYTFKNSTITSVSVPASITEIGEYAFLNCQNLSTLTVPSSVNTIGKAAFSGCSSLESITLPFVGGRKTASVASEETLFGYVFGERVYSGGTKQFYSGDNTTSVGGPYFYFPPRLKSVTILGEDINYGAFSNCEFLTNVILSGGSSIGGCAFYWCNGLTSITIPNSVTSIGERAFWYCSSLQYNEYDNGYYLGNDNNPYLWLIKVKNTSITSCTIHEDTKFIYSSAFSDCSNLQYNEYDNGYYLGNDNNPYLWLIKAKNTSITSCTIHEDTKFICSNAFSSCSSLTSITIPDSVTSIGNSAFEDCRSLTSITIPDSVTSIGNSAFRNCSKLTSITIPDGVTSIGERAFEDCSSLTSITIGNGVTSIGDYAFNNCPIETATIPAIACSYVNNSNLKTVVITSGESIGYDAFYNCRSLTSITIPDSVTSIGEGAFFNCSSLTSITIPDSVTSIGWSAFENCNSLTSVYYTGDIASWCGITFSGSTSNPLYYAHNLYIDNESIKKIVIPDTVTKIKAHAFSGWNGTSITIPASVTSIGERAFEDCSSLTSVYYTGDIASWCGITFGTYNSNPLYYAHNLYINNELIKDIVIPDTVTEIKDWVFCGWNGTSITIPDSVTSIGERAFEDCRSLTSITIPDSVTSIGNSAFEDCRSLTSITIPDSVTSIGGGAFSDCSSLTSITIPDSVTSIGYEAFYNCSSLTSITFQGTKAQWNAISKGSYWNFFTGNYTVHCTDGDILK